MAATTRPPSPSPAVRLVRFGRLERAVHWSNAAIFAVLVATGAALYLQPVGALVGRRHLVEEIHVYCGLALPVPLLAAIAGRWGGALREDLRRFNRWTPADRLWLRSILSRREERDVILADLRSGKFNAGQKLNAAFTAGAGLVMLGTGVVMRWYSPWPLSWRTGATFVHDWLAVALAVVIAGHVAMALTHPESLRSMLTGRVSRAWAEVNAAAWLGGGDGTPPGDPQPTSWPRGTRSGGQPASETAEEHA